MLQGNQIKAIKRQLANNYLIHQPPLKRLSIQLLQSVRMDVQEIRLRLLLRLTQSQ